MDGILIVNKKEGITSREVVNRIGKILDTKKIGHTGTLDPMATGVLILCIGKATKLVELLTATEKEYIAEMTLGIETDTLDITGTILKEEPFEVNQKEVEQIFQTMIGSYEQEVPLYSAIHIKGKKLYEYARNQEEVKLPSRTVTILDLELLEINQNKILFRTKVSKGTYIRSLVRDIAHNLNTIGTMSKLTRIKQGKFKIEDSFTLEEIEQQNFSLLPIKDVLTDYKTIEVDCLLEQKIKNGQLILSQYEDTTILFLSKNGTPLALYHTYQKDPTYLKPWKML